MNIWTVNKGKAAATADRTIVLAANAEALYILIEGKRTSDKRGTIFVTLKTHK